MTLPVRAKITITAVILCAIMALAWVRLHGRGDPEWGVLVFGLPSEISAKDALRNTSYYILKQTHEPVFRKDDGQNYRSRMLKRWSRNLRSSEFEFCPETELWFNNQERLGFERFLSHLERVTASYDPSASIVGVEGCVRVRFPRGRKGYLDYLTRYENAPGIKRTETIEDGLGEYAVEDISREAIVLKRKRRTPGSYQTIAFYDYKGKRDPNLQNKNIKDFNLIPLFDIPGWAVKDYFSFNTVEIKSLNLIINHPDLKVRKAVYNCMGTTQLRRALFPQKKDFHDIRTLLPVGMPGSREGVPEQQCGPWKYKAAVPLRFANWNEDSRATLTEFVNSVNSEAGMNIRVVNYDPGELLKMVHTSPHPYNMIAIALETTRPDYSAFFKYFFSENGYYDFKLGGLRTKYEGVLKEEDAGRKSVLAGELAQELADQALVLTLYQNVKTLYYPKEIKHLMVGKGFLQYPEVASLQI